jgi:hypothetical protein
MDNLNWEAIGLFVAWVSLVLAVVSLVAFYKLRGD